MSMLFSDLALSRRLERCEARSSAAFVEARAAITPASGACWIEAGGALAMFDGVDSPLTQSFGFGLFAPPEVAHLEALERFFSERGAPVFHEVSPLAGLESLPLFAERGYHPVELTSVLFRPLESGDGAVRQNGAISARLIVEGEEDLWASIAAAGWNDVAPELGAFLLDLGRVHARQRNTACFFGLHEGRPVATGALSVHDGVALLAGASTIPEWRGRGAQRALLEARLRAAVEARCDLAMMGALPGSASQRNAERQKFRIAYTRIKWGR